MKALRLTVPLGPQETPASYTSRLAAANGLSAREFCPDWGLRFQSVVDGNTDAIATIARLGGVDPVALTANAFIKLAKQDFEYRGERLVRHTLRRIRVHVCPACLIDDIHRNPKLAPKLAVNNRAAWMIDAIHTCPAHDIGLVQVAIETNAHALHDFVHQIEPALDRLKRLAAKAPRRRPTGLENYVIARLDGGRQSPFLDTLELHAAIRTCEIIGAVDVFGRNANLRLLNDEEWRRAGASGFGIASGGAETIETFLNRLQKSYPRTRNGNERPQALFGRLYQWLAFFVRGDAFNPVRTVVGRYIQTRFPVGPGDHVFGEPVTHRMVHSIYTLSSETGVHPVRLRKTLRAAAIIDDRQMSLTDNLVLFDAERAATVVRKSSGALSLPAAGKCLNASRKQTEMLAQNQFIEPYLPARALSIRDRYATDELDAFLDRLFAGAEAVRKRRSGMVHIPTAAKRACCSSADIVRLILDRKLSWTGKAAGQRGYLSLLVNVEEVRTKVRRPDHGGLTKVEVMKRLHTTSAVLSALIKHGHLTTLPVINPVNRYHQVVISLEEFDRFNREYVSLYVLTQEQGKHFTVVQKALDQRGIEPAFKPRKIGATFYWRSDC
jgi:hypothetical protein